MPADHGYARAAMPRITPVTPEDALELATATHLAGRRVDMGTLARELGVGRATLYRWFGSREELLEQMLLARAQTFIEMARGQARGSGEERLIATIRIVVRSAAEARPVRWLIEREPTLALRILAGQRGRLHELLVEESLRDLARTRSEVEVEELRERVDATIQLVTALLWVAIAVGEEPPVERIERLARELLSRGPAAARPRSRRRGAHA
jgi:AcrR family transcriptional regulator